MASTDMPDTIYHTHENILDLIPTVQNEEFSISVEPAKSLKSFSLFRHGCNEKYISFVIMGVLKGLEYIHVRENLVHGNINLDNVFVDNDCKVKLESPMRKNCQVDQEQKTDIQMVGELALSLSTKKSGIKFFLGYMRKKKKTGLVENLVKFCLNPSRTPTLREVINHEFFKEFGEFDRYQEKLKKRLQKKLCKI
ncbi:hypothetical protein POM88_042596 [Heracleum sosnowskyi]|uniref:Protein kinase domain-containing protein n=1 Tax=Heracleum sosnowskyi TaxID=360622 RepID=A0AAD8M9C3_9APIA|nr:hypothetical protein POM88_042596 [Heracleum sosnowskyi]